MDKHEKEAMRIINRFYRIENGYQYCEAKKEALICIDEILNLLYNEFYDINNGVMYEFYLKVKNQIEKI